MDNGSLSTFQGRSSSASSFGRFRRFPLSYSFYFITQQQIQNIAAQTLACFFLSVGVFAMTQVTDVHMTKIVTSLPTPTHLLDTGSSCLPASSPPLPPPPHCDVKQLLSSFLPAALAVYSIIVQTLAALPKTAEDMSCLPSTMPQFLTCW